MRNASPVVNSDLRSVYCNPVSRLADSATGTPAFNKELSLKRAQAVKNALVKNYGIAADRLNVEAGGGVDKFGQPILNRVVLVKSAN